VFSYILLGNKTTTRDRALRKIAEDKSKQAHGAVSETNKRIGCGGRAGGRAGEMLRRQSEIQKQ